METPQPEPIVTSPQRPTVRLFIVCADAVLQLPQTEDLQYAFWEIHNPYNTVWMPPGVDRGFNVEKLFAYVQLTDGLGTFTIGLQVEQVDLANPKRNRLMGRSDPTRITIESPWDVVEELIELDDVVYPLPGLYLFSLMESGQEVPGGTMYIRVMPGDIERTRIYTRTLRHEEKDSARDQNSTPHTRTAVGGPRTT